MALFKILNNFASGNAITSVNTYTQGYCYFDKNTGKFWIDTTNTEAGRVAINGSFYGVSSSNASAVAKTVICPGFILSTGATVYVKFNNTNTADIGSITLNINNTGAKPIRYHGELLPDAGYLKAGTTYCFIYDS